MGVDRNDLWVGSRGCTGEPEENSSWYNESHFEQLRATDRNGDDKKIEA